MRENFIGRKSKEFICNMKLISRIVTNTAICRINEMKSLFLQRILIPDT